MRQVYLILWLFIATSASFSQYIEKTDNTNFQLWYSKNETEESAIKFLSENEDKYYSARNKFKLGVIMGGVSASAFWVFPIATRRSDIFPLFIGMSAIAYGTPFVVSIPFTIVGAVRMHKYKKYKPTVSVSPSKVNFSINF